MELDKAKKDKQRLLGFTSSAKNPSLKTQTAQVATGLPRESDLDEFDKAIGRPESYSMSPVKQGSKKEPDSASMPNSMAQNMPRKASTSGT